MEKPFTYQFFTTTTSAWEAMYQAIAGAKKSIYWEVYRLVDDPAGNRFVDVLCDKAEQGLDVKVIIDGFGSLHLSKLAIERMKAKGVTLLVFHQLNPEWSVQRWIRRMWYRTHRKVLIIDEETAFIGGVNVTEEALEWDDLHVQLSGKIIRPLLYGFAKSYVHAGGKRKDVRNLLHPKLSNGLADWRKRIRIILHSPLYAPRQSPFRRFYHQALDMAKESFNLLTPYYVPDRQFLELVSRARKKGVEVNIILPWKTDMRIMEYVARAFYGLTRKTGAAFHFLRKMNHGKAVSVDNKMGSVGSANLTTRSFFFDQEAGVAFSEQQMVDDLNHILDDWKQQAIPLTDINLHTGGWFKRFKDWWMRKITDYT